MWAIATAHNEHASKDSQIGVADILNSVVISKKRAFTYAWTRHDTGPNTNRSLLSPVASTLSNIVFDDIFTTDAIDMDGKKIWSRSGLVHAHHFLYSWLTCAVYNQYLDSRLYSRPKNYYDMDLTLDCNIDSELFPLVNGIGDSFAMALASSLSWDQIVKMVKTEMETYGDQMVIIKEGEVLKKIMTLLCMGKCEWLSFRHPQVWLYSLAPQVYKFDTGSSDIV